jgi:hypothetical protein
MNCPNCQFSEWRSASLIYAEGLTSTSGTVIGAAGSPSGTGFSDDQGIGVGLARSEGHSQTELSSLAAPPEPEGGKELTYYIIALIIILIAFLIGWKKDDIVIGFLYAFITYFPTAIVLNVIYPESKRKAEREEVAKRYAAALSEYQRKVMCTRCGTFYLRDDLGVRIQETGMASSESIRDAKSLT